MDAFKQNLERLQAVRPDLATKVIVPLPARVELRPSKTHLPTLIYHSPQGEKLLHSRYDPLREAQAFAASLAGAWDHLVVMGLGLGYSILPLLDHKRSEQRVLIFEPDAAIFSASLHLIDWASLLSSRDDLFLAVAPSELELASEIQRFFSITVYNKLTVAHLPSEKTIFTEAFKWAEEAIDSQIRTLFYDFKTRLAESGMVSQNILRNLPYILKTRPLRTLAQRFANRPGIIVSAGPSLDANIFLLKRVRDRAVIIAVDTALKPLLARGIQPHFTVTADPSYKNYRHLLGTKGQIKHYLLAETAISTQVFRDFSSQLFTVSIGKPLLSFCEQVTGPIGELDAWGSVISLAFSFAIYLGLEPLTFIGQDFAYTHMRNHCRNSSWEESWRLENPSLENLQRMERQSISGQLVQDQDIFGRSVYTSDRLVLYKDYLARMLSSFKDHRIFNSSEGGILKEIPFLPLDEFLGRYLPGQEAIDFTDLKILPPLGNPRVNHELGRLFLAQMRFFKKYNRKVEKLIENLRQSEPNGPTDPLEAAEQLRQELYAQTDRGNMVEMWSQMPIYHFLRGQKKMPLDTQSADYIQQALTLYRDYFQSLHSIITSMIKSFEAVIPLL